MSDFIAHLEKKPAGYVNLLNNSGQIDEKTSSAANGIVR
jgi:hypothetical protein